MSPEQAAASAFPVVHELPDAVETVPDLIRWWRSNRAELDAHVLSAGAVLVRCVPVATPSAFAEVASEVCGGLSGYTDGSAERLQLAEHVYTASEYPPDQRISLHNELSYSAAWPERLCFGCLTPAATGGETTLVDGRALVEALPADLVDEFEARRVRYTRRLRHRDVGGIGLSWQAAFEATQRDDVERSCRRLSIDFHWNEDGSLSTAQCGPGTMRHPVTGAWVWFNQADQFHPSNLGAELAEDMYLLFDEPDLPTNATFGDGGAIDPAALDEVRRIADSLVVARPWEQGDLLVIDNVLTADGRMPFSGERRVLVSMGSLQEHDAAGGAGARRAQDGAAAPSLGPSSAASSSARNGS